MGSFKVYYDMGFGEQIQHFPDFPKALEFLEHINSACALADVDGGHLYDPMERVYDPVIEEWFDE